MLKYDQYSIRTIYIHMTIMPTLLLSYPIIGEKRYHYNAAVKNESKMSFLEQLLIFN